MLRRRREQKRRASKRIKSPGAQVLLSDIFKKDWSRFKDSVRRTVINLSRVVWTGYKLGSRMKSE